MLATRARACVCIFIYALIRLPSLFCRWHQRPVQEQPPPLQHPATVQVPEGSIWDEPERAASRMSPRGQHPGARGMCLPYSSFLAQMSSGSSHSGVVVLHAATQLPPALHLPGNAEVPGLLPFLLIGPALDRNHNQQHFRRSANAQLPCKPLMLREADPGEVQCGATPGK